MSDVNVNETADASVVAPRNSSRRRFLVGSGLAAAAAAAACGGDDDNATSTTTAPAREDETTTTAMEDMAGMSSEADLAVASFAAGLEKLAVDTYTAAADAAGQGALGEVPAAIGEFVATALGHHQAAFDAWNGVLEANGQSAVTEAGPGDLVTTVNTQLNDVADVVGAAELALTLEQIASATYLDLIPTLEGTDAIALAGSIQPIDMQHQSVLLFALGRYPVPDTFGQTSMSVAPE